VKIYEEEGSPDTCMQNTDRTCYLSTHAVDCFT
jgi:hypothetical protein